LVALLYHILDDLDLVLHHPSFLEVVVYAFELGGSQSMATCSIAFYVSGEHLPHPRVALAENMTGPIHEHLTHQGNGEGFELISEVLSATLRGRSHTVHLALVA
jgi:hypothetical protein